MLRGVLPVTVSYMTEAIEPATATSLPRTFLSSLLTAIKAVWTEGLPLPEEEEDPLVLMEPPTIDPLTFGFGLPVKARLNRLDNTDLNQLLKEAAEVHGTSPEVTTAK